MGSILFWLLGTLIGLATTTLLLVARYFLLINSRFDFLLTAQEKVERNLHADVNECQRGLRSEFFESTRSIREELAHTQEALRQALSRDASAARQELGESLGKLGSSLSEQLQRLVQINESRMRAVQDTVDHRLRSLQSENSLKLDEMRHTVDEKLHVALEQRLGESFKLVSERLEAVHQGLGEMQSLATGVGDLKRVLTNVKSRGTWGEVQLARLMDDIMTPEQYSRNVKPIPESDAIVEFAIRLPGQGQGTSESPIWLPIDAKFPKEEYERLLEAQEIADTQAIKDAGIALGRTVEVQARLIATKYISPPYTTDFAIMFLPIEGLYAEVLRLPGLLDRLHGLRINVAGPSNLAALLNSLQMGFRTIAIEQRSSEVWHILRAVKSEFNKFGIVLSGVKKTLETASNKIGYTETRTRVMLRNLRKVEALPDKDSKPLTDNEKTNEFSEDVE